MTLPPSVDVRLANLQGAKLMLRAIISDANLAIHEAEHLMQPDPAIKNITEPMHELFEAMIKLLTDPHAH